MKVGEVVTGTVLGIKPYGLFIDLSGPLGLLHISEISYLDTEPLNIAPLNSFFKLNDQVKVKLIDC